MAATYELVNDYLGQGQDVPAPAHIDEVDLDPYWVIAVWRMRYPLTFERRTLASTTSIDIGQTVDTLPTPLIITGLCSQLSVERNKGNYLMSMSAHLRPGGPNFLVEILPKDVCAAWIFSHRDQAKDLIAALNRGLPDAVGGSASVTNGFNSGLRFLGRVKSLRKQLSVTGGTGLKSLGYQLQATGFNEFSTQFFYEQGLTELIPELGMWAARIGTSLDDLTRTKEGTGDMQSAAVMKVLLEMFFGKGIPPGFGHEGDTLQNTTGGTSPDPKESPYGFIMPEVMGKLLGKRSASKAGGVLAYADLLEVILGLQKYVDTAAGGGRSTLSPASYQPTGFSSGDGSGTTFDDNGNLHLCTHDIYGAFPAQRPEVFGKPVWTLLQQYLNPAINEMYTCLRVNARGAIVPTLVIRQIPFTTSAFAKAHEDDPDMPTTSFLELPRWRLHPVLVEGMDIGRSDAEHFNFVHVYGQNGIHSPLVNPTLQLVRFPPIRDDLDIVRSGPQVLQATVNCGVAELVGKNVNRWNSLCADFYCGSEFSLNGTINAYYLQAPLAIGDNLEFDGVVYHIESILDSCQIDSRGKKSAITSLQLSHGMRATPAAITGLHYQYRNPDLGQYAGIYSDDTTALEPGTERGADGSTPPSPDPQGHAIANSAATAAQSAEEEEDDDTSG